jgi:hypothetical protein
MRVRFVRRGAGKKISDGLAGDPVYRRSNLRDDVPRSHRTLVARSQIQHHTRRKPADESKVFPIRKGADHLWQMKRKRIGVQSREQSKLAGCAFGKIAWSVAPRQCDDERIAGSGGEFYVGRENVP